MSKRHLSDRQKRHIQQRRSQEAENLDLQPGLVVAHHGKHVLVEDPDTGERHSCTFRQTLGGVVTGDRVRWRASPEGKGSVEFVEPRESLLIRPDTLGKPRMMASNIDQVLITLAPVPEPNASVIDRAIVATLDLPARPILLINKVDLVDDEGLAMLREFVSEWTSLGIEAIELSASTGEGLDRLRAALRDHESLFVGLSGVGKSSIVRSLLPEGSGVAVGAISEHSLEGKHTTRTSTLYHLPDGGDVVDAPGIRDFGVWDMTPEAIKRGFAEIERAARSCRFANCTHRAEPGCAVKQAVEDGEISARRFAGYLELMELATARRS
ncbi:MAG: ribosome small subunit-dependent GTPase A [Halothiobacillaceae bacterium]|nr:MAG: ribosome small subunit-dependent GTPase A [Halothiobacillaceae bacterium]